MDKLESDAAFLTIVCLEVTDDMEKNLKPVRNTPYLACVGGPWPFLHSDPGSSPGPNRYSLCSPRETLFLSKPQSLDQGKEDFLGTWGDRRVLSLGGASELGSNEQECAGTQMMTILWGMGMTGWACPPPGRIMKKNSQRNDSSAPIVYSFIKHSGHPGSLTLRHPSPAEP